MITSLATVCSAGIQAMEWAASYNVELDSCKLLHNHLSSPLRTHGTKAKIVTYDTGMEISD